MTEELHERYTEDKVHYDLMRQIFQEEIIKVDIDSKIDAKTKSKMVGVYWILGVLVLLYIAVVGPISSSVIGLSAAVSAIKEAKASKVELESLKNERERDYVKKIDYFKMEVDEHEKLKEAILFPIRAEYILKAINDHIQFEMNLNYTTVRGGGVK